MGSFSIGAASTLLPYLALAAGQGVDGQGTYPRTLHTGNFCAAVEAQTLEAEPKHESVLYQYQTLLYDAAGVKPSDDEATVARKARDAMNHNMPMLLCDRFNFIPRFGNVLKLAVARGAGPFIDQAIYVWQIDLNQVDQADGGTVLDYIARKRVDAGSNANLEAVYQRYYDQFRKAGAKHARELP